MAINVNTVRLPPSTALKTALAERLHALLGKVDWLRGWEVCPPAHKRKTNFDLLANLPLPGGGHAALFVVCKRELRPSMFRLVAEKTFTPEDQPKLTVPVLALPFVSPRIAQLCAGHGWSWFDLAGNCHIDVPGLLHLQHSGNKPVHKTPRPAANLGSPESGRIIRVLLHHENTGKRWTQRGIHSHCDPTVHLGLEYLSLGLVNKVVRHLRNEAFIEHTPDGRFSLIDPLGLLFAWRDAYRFDRHERRAYYSRFQGRGLREALAKLESSTGGYAAYASFSAAEFQAPHVRQPKTWLFLKPQFLSEFEQVAEATQVDSGENVVLLIPDDDGVFYLGEGGPNHLGCTNLIQTYVDLWHSGGRGMEAAEALLEQRLKPEWRLRGAKA